MTFARKLSTALISLAALYALASWVAAFVVLGVISAKNEVFLLLADLTGTTLLWAVSGITMLIATYSAVRRRHADVMAYLCAAAVTLLTPSLVRATVPFFTQQAELRDLRRVGIAALRSEAAALADANKVKKYPWRWFGGEVPEEDLLPAVRALAVRASYVTADDHGIVLVTGGIASWRGGYRITPPGSTYVPEWSRKISDGVFYQITK